MAVYRHRNKWMYDFVKNDKRYREGGFATKKEAVEQEAKTRTAARKINMDFLRLCTSRLEDLEARRSKGHFERNRLIFESLIRRWSMKTEITMIDVEELLQEVAEESRQKANRYLAMIKALFRHGIKRKLVDYDPTIGVEPYGIDKARKYIPPEEDLKKVLDLAPKNFRDYLVTIIHSAARMREINRLRWEDVNFNEDYIVLRTRKAKNSKVSERKVPLTRTLKSVLEQLPQKGEYVFSHSSGKKKGKRYDNRIKYIRSLCEKAEVKRFTFHNLRHYSASKMANAGVAITDIQEILGHTKTTTTNDYLQAIKGSLRSAINKLEENPPPNPPPEPKSQK